MEGGPGREGHSGEGEGICRGTSREKARFGPKESICLVVGTRWGVPVGVLKVPDQSVE